ncbi:Homeobox-leucine zipper protein HOX7 [Linum grandiflorum]
MDEAHEECCNTGLALALAITEPCNTTKKSSSTTSVSFNLFPKQEEGNRKSSSSTDGGDNGLRPIDGGRKKLRLTKEQSTLLENTFHLHTTLTHAQKQSLAERLNLTPRQVEVWFQNRRARFSFIYFTLRIIHYHI